MSDVITGDAGGQGGGTAGGDDAAAAAAAAAAAGTGTPEEQAAAAAAKAKEGDEDTLTGAKKPEDAPVAPEEYKDFNLPEGMVMDTDALASFQGLAKEANLPQDVAQKFVTDYAQRLQQATEAQETQWHETLTGWRNDVKSDSELGGPAFDQSIANANKFLEHFGTAELKTALNELGVGNHPEFIRAFARAGKAMGEDKFTAGGAASGGPRKTAEEVMYPNQGKI